MIELRLCSIKAASWLDSLSANVAVVIKPPSDLGLMFGRGVRARLDRVQSVAELLASPVSGLVLALDGIRFNEDLLISAIHAVAYAGVSTTIDEVDHAHQLDEFIRGKRVFSEVPQCLQRVGVFGCMQGRVARRFGAWIESVDRSILKDSICEMHGADALGTYLAVIDDIKRSLLIATQIHGCDICSMRVARV